jgi:DDE superfamily endonuclease
MDNFPAHEAGLEQVRDSLTNTKVKWLLPNATSIH